MIRKWLQKLNYNEAFVFTGTRQDLSRILNYIYDVDTRQINKNTIRLFAKRSLGTAHRFAPPINLTMTISDLGADRLQINLITKTRVEQYGIFVLFVLFAISVPASGESIWLFVFVLGLWPITHWWFHVFHRAQENDLYNLIVKNLRLEELHRFSA